MRFTSLPISSSSDLQNQTSICRNFYPPLIPRTRAPSRKTSIRAPRLPRKRKRNDWLGSGRGKRRKDTWKVWRIMSSSWPERSKDMISKFQNVRISWLRRSRYRVRYFCCYSELEWTCLHLWRTWKNLDFWRSWHRPDQSPSRPGPGTSILS